MTNQTTRVSVVGHVLFSFFVGYCVLTVCCIKMYAQEFRSVTESDKTDHNKRDSGSRAQDFSKLAEAAESSTDQFVEPKPSHVTCECQIIRVPRDALRDLFGDTPLGRINLVKEETLRRISDMERLQRITIGSQIKLTTISGAQAQVRAVQEVIYPTELDAESGSPAGFKTREIGGLLNLIPTVGSDGKTINITLIPEFSTIAMPERMVEVNVGRNHKMVVISPDVRFASKNLTTSFIMRSGTTVLLAACNPSDEEGPDAKNFIWLFLFTGTVVEIDQVEAPAPE